MELLRELLVARNRKDLLLLFHSMYKNGSRIREHSKPYHFGLRKSERTGNGGARDRGKGDDQRSRDSAAYELRINSQFSSPFISAVDLHIVVVVAINAKLNAKAHIWFDIFRSTQFLKGLNMMI